MAKQKRPRDANPYAVGKVVYNGGSNSPHRGTKLDPLGYKERDNKARIRRNALLRRMKAAKSGRYNDPDWLRRKG